MLPFQYMNDYPSLPIYKTRGFWILVNSILLSSNLVLSLIFFVSSEINLDNLGLYLGLATGATLLMLIGANLASVTGMYVGLVLNFSLLAYLLRKVFSKKKNRHEIWGSITCLLLLQGLIIAFLFLGSFR